VLLLEVSTLHGPEMHLDISALQRHVPHWQVSTLHMHDLYLDVSTIQRPVLLLDVVYSYITVAEAAPGLIFTTEACAASILIYTQGPEVHLDLLDNRRLCCS
jgi:hypothetical protein